MTIKTPAKHDEVHVAAAPNRTIRKVLIANRGEIAVRLIRATHEMGMRSVAVYSEADRTALHVRLADEALCIGPGPSSESYLRIDHLIDAARKAGADAVHPGYGFLAENAEFAAAVVDAGLVYVGPGAEAIASMGNKLEAHEIAKRTGVPRIPSSDGAVEDPEEAKRIAEQIGYPVMLKAAAGGGGKGMRTVHGPDELVSALELVRGEARSAFGDDQVFLERLVQKPHHVEIQVLADHHGNVVYLGERDCSVQRRHQKVIEETPSPIIDDATRKAMGEAAVALTKAVSYRNAATVEFLVDDQQRFYFLEMNTRLQVEHPITEIVTGIDIVKEQLRIASGEKLRFAQEDIKPRGAAMEFRIYAEDPAHNFVPSLGVIRRLRLPSGPGVRNDAGIYPGYEIPIFYDPMIAKLVVWGRDREDARGRAARALEEYLVAGVRTNLPFHRWIVDHPRFQSGDFDTGFIAEEWAPDRIEHTDDEYRIAMIAATVQALHDRQRVARISTEAAATDGGGSRWRFQHRPDRR